jgi:hypothetical protein
VVRRVFGSFMFFVAVLQLLIVVKSSGMPWVNIFATALAGAGVYWFTLPRGADER